MSEPIVLAFRRRHLGILDFGCPLGVWTLDCGRWGRARRTRRGRAVRIGENYASVLQRLLAGWGDGEAAVLVVRVAAQSNSPIRACLDDLGPGDEAAQETADLRLR